MVTIYDIAKETGFSPATVSKALNNYRGVKKETYDAIMKCAKQMGYTVNVNARSLVTKKSYLIGVLFSTDVDTGIAHPHFSEILQYFQKTAGQKGYDVIFVNKNLGDQKMSFLDHCRLRRVDGVVLAANKKYTSEVQSVVDSDLNMVSVEAIYPGKYSILSDNRMGSVQAMEYLYSLGHRRIAHIAAPLDSTAGKERYDGYRSFLAKNGIKQDKRLLVESSGYCYDAGYNAIRKLLQQSAGDMPTAIYCAYDETAFSVITILNEQGFRVPEDISVVGFDNLASARHINQGLTTIGQQRAEIGRKAAEILIDLMEGTPIHDPMDIRVPTSLVIRKTTARVDTK